MSSRTSTTATKFHAVTRPRGHNSHSNKAAKPQAAAPGDKSPTLSHPRKSPQHYTRSSPARSAAPTSGTKKRKRKRVEESGAEDELSPPRKRHDRQGTAGPDRLATAGAPGRKQVAVPMDEDHHDDAGDIEEELLLPTWADPLIELDARASQATRIKEKYHALYLNGRVIGRLMGFAESPDKVIAYAVAMHGVPHEDRPCNSAHGPHPDDTLELAHHALVDFFPDWDNAVPLLKKDSSLITKLGTYLGKVAAKARSDDIVRLKKHVIWAARIEDTKGTLADKRHRGMYEQNLARMLCPKSKLDLFDEDPSAFCQDVVDAQQHLRSCDWWSGMYDLDRAVPGEFRPGLGMSDFGRRCHLILWCSANSADYENTTGKKKKGQPSLSRKYKIENVTLLSIIYTYVLARFCITSTTEWSSIDGAWSVKEFVKSILDFAHKNPQWHGNLVAWWTRQIYGAAHNEQMTQDEFEQTAFYLAMNNEDDENDDFEERSVSSPPAVVRKKRMSAPVKRQSPLRPSPSPVASQRPSPPRLFATPAPLPPKRRKPEPVRRYTPPVYDTPRHFTPSDGSNHRRIRSRIARPLFEDEHSDQDEIVPRRDEQDGDEEDGYEDLRDPPYHEEDPCDGLYDDEEPRDAPLAHEDPRDGQGDSGDARVKHEREGTAGVIGGELDADDVDGDTGPRVEDAYTLYNATRLVNTTTSGKSSSPSLAARMKLQFATMLEEDDAEYNEEDPEESEVIAHALELLKARSQKVKKAAAHR